MLGFSEMFSLARSLSIDTPRSTSQLIQVDINSCISPWHVYRKAGAITLLFLFMEPMGFLVNLNNFLEMWYSHFSGILLTLIISHTLPCFGLNGNIRLFVVVCLENCTNLPDLLKFIPLRTFKLCSLIYYWH